jgi:SAM-dependent methyltransferase
MAERLAPFIHRLVSRPNVYNLVQRLVGASVVSTHLKEHIATLGPTGVVLDLGGGTGLYRELWPTEWRYICLDSDPEKLHGFVRRNPGDNMLLADVSAVPLPDHSLDAVLCTFVSHHLSDGVLEAFVDESARVLRPGGALIFVDAVWRPERIVSRLLWRYDRGAYPRTKDRLLTAISASFEIATVELFAVLHEYLLCVATTRLLAVPSDRSGLSTGKNEVPVDTGMQYFFRHRELPRQ